jgi:hypothetical protein
MIYKVSKKTILILSLVIFFFLLWCTSKNIWSTQIWIGPKLIWETNSDCTYQETACYNCGCPTAINKSHKVNISCPKSTNTNQCNLGCPYKKLECLNKTCTIK